MKVKGISKSFSGKEVLNKISFTVPDGEFFFITGPSGCGKTTLLNIIAGIEKPDSGSVSGAEKVSYLFQEPRLLPWKTAFENVALVSSSEKAAKYLELVRMSGDSKKYPYELSGGQRQRVAIARALAYESEVLLLDEPFQNLDEKLHQELVSEIIKLHESDKRTVIWVTHNLQEVKTVIGDNIQNCIEIGG